MKTVIPANFCRFWAASDALLPWAEEQVAMVDYLPEHLELIENYMNGVDALRQSKVNSDRHVAVVGILLRTFDGLAHAVRASLTGNYSGAAMYARDLLETAFLLDFLLSQNGMSEKWLHAKPTEIRRSFAPRVVREYLDKRDGLTGMKRKNHYDLLSSLGSHPTPSALELKRDGTRMINAGPFKHRDLMRKLLEELAKIALLLLEQLLTYSSEVREMDDMRSRLSLLAQRKISLYTNRK